MTGQGADRLGSWERLANRQAVVKDAAQKAKDALGG